MSLESIHLAWSPRRRRYTANAVLAIVLLLVAASVPDLARSAWSGLLLRQDDRQVGRVAAGSPGEAAGFRKGDVLLVSPSPRARPRPGETTTFDVSRDGRQLTLALTYAPLPGRELVRKLSLGLVAVAFFVVGWLVYVRRGDLTALVFSLFCLDIGYVIANVMNRPGWMVSHPFFDKTLYDASVLLLPALFVHFFLLFPERDPRLARRPALSRWLYVPSGLAIVLAGAFNSVLLRPGAVPGQGARLFESVTSLGFLAAFLAGAVLFVRSYDRTRSPVVRRRLRGVVIGTVAGVAPLVIGQAVFAMVPGVEIPGLRVSALALVLVPLSFGHAIVRYGMFDLEIVVKRGAVYAILTAILAGVYLAIVNGLGHLIAQAAPRGRGVLTVAAILLMAVVFTPLRMRIEAWVDRTFYRERRGHRETLRRLARGLARVMELDDLLDLVAGSLEETFHPEHLTLFVRAAPGETEFAAARLRGSHGGPVGSRGDLAELARWLAAHGETVNLERSFAGSLPAGIPLRLRRMLSAARVAVLVPFVSEGEMVAFLLLGPKKSEETIAGEDTELLDTVADQAAMAIQNAWLHRDALQRREIARDLATARQVQRALLPERTPAIPGFELDVVSLPCREIGGDLYDCIPLATGRWAFLIGDAAGSGIGAALLMAALQATVHAESLDLATPAQVVSAANERLTRRRDDNRFASLVYVELDPAEARLTSVNAGHPPPIIVSAGGEVRELGEGGMLLGVEPSAGYDQEEVTLPPGALVLFYTDGIIEHANADGDDFGRERLADLVRGSRRLPLAEIAEVVLRAVAAHGSAPIQDDATLLLLRRSEEVADRL